MAVASAKFEAGQAFLPERAAWLPDLEAELFVFPGGRHDDQCDSMSQALLDDNLGAFAWLTPADWQNVLAQASVPTRWSTRRRFLIYFVNEGSSNPLCSGRCSRALVAPPGGAMTEREKREESL